MIFLPSLQLSQRQLLNGISIWIFEVSGRTIASIDGHYINTVVYDPLRGSSYLSQPVELQNPSKGLVNIKNNDNECFRWCHARFLDPQNVKDPQRIKKSDRKVTQDLDYDAIEFSFSAKDNAKIEGENKININVFGYENKQFYPIHVSKGSNDDELNLLLITEGEKKHYVLIKDFDELLFNKTKHKNKKNFVCTVFNVLVHKRYFPNIRPTAW